MQSQPVHCQSISSTSASACFSLGHQGHEVGLWNKTLMEFHLLESLKLLPGEPSLEAVTLLVEVGEPANLGSDAHDYDYLPFSSPSWIHWKDNFDEV